MQRQDNKIKFSSQTAKDAYTELQNDPNTAHDEAWGTLDDGVDISGTIYNEERAEEIETEKFGTSTPEAIDINNSHNKTS